MRHKKKTKYFSRTTGERKALFSNLSRQLLEHGRIETTTAKAKFLRTVVEPLITRAKNGTVHDRREAAKILKGKKDKTIIKKLFDEIGPVYKDRKGGYTRILKLKNRKGDNAEISIIELVEREKIYKTEELDDAKGKKGKTPKDTKEKPPKGKSVKEKQEKTRDAKSKPVKDNKTAVKKQGKIKAKES
ncbi:MAG TPA: 50S ribosomal protein L17 [Firmicutes bacterium]|nr:50S ribosomal protein L17 [Bacillota bacterium]